MFEEKVSADVNREMEISHLRLKKFLFSFVRHNYHIRPTELNGVTETTPNHN